MKKNRRLQCKNCGELARTYYDKEMFAVDGEGYVTDCGTGGCGFTTGRTRTGSRENFKRYRANGS
jgi:hypothetical protein